ncbi:MAG: type VI secretion system contractile sheath large subunit [Acetobacteraceae bacterium]
MRYEVSFGSISRAPRAASAGAKFRLALLGDFSGRANAGRLETGAALAARKPIKVDVDNIDQVIERMQLSLALPLAEDGGAVTVPIRSLDDFHPDQLAENVELFEQLLDLRRRLGSRTGFDRAAKEVLSWSGGAPLPRAPRKARGAAVASDCRLSDFARLVGRPAVADAEEASVDDLIRRLVAPYIQPKRDARQDQLIARVDEALSGAMRRVLHHPDFQAAEAIWRGVEFLVRRIETGERMEIVLYDVSAEEFAADIAATDALEETGLYGMLVEQPALDAAQGRLSAIIGLYGFELAPPHADLLGRVARIAAAARAPFVAGIDPDALKTRFHDQHPLIKDAWSALHGLPEAAYLGLAAPRFLLRPPYGRKSDPIDAFSFEEFTPQGGLGAMLWGHPALLSGLLLAENWLQQGKAMRLGTVMGVGEMPYFVYAGADGDQVALPCTERLYTEREAVQVAAYRVMPLLSLRGRPEVRLGGFTSLAGGTLAGFWAPAEMAAPQSAAVAPASEADQPDQSEPEAPAVADTPVPAVDEAAVPDGGAGATDDLDALLAGLSAPAPAAPDAAAAAGGEVDELDALLAGLNARPPAAAPDAPEADLDALLASLK